MTWYKNGAWSGVLKGELKDICIDLAMAIKERHDIIYKFGKIVGGTPPAPKFYTQNGRKEADVITSGDMEGMKNSEYGYFLGDVLVCLGLGPSLPPSVGNPNNQNIFVSSVSSDGVWAGWCNPDDKTEWYTSAADVATKLGLPTIQPTGSVTGKYIITDFDLWDWLRKILTEMQYIRFETIIHGVAGTTTLQRYADGNNIPDQEQAWDDMKASAPVSMVGAALAQQSAIYSNTTFKEAFWAHDDQVEGLARTAQVPSEGDVDDVAVYFRDHQTFRTGDSPAWNASWALHVNGSNVGSPSSTGGASQKFDGFTSIVREGDTDVELIKAVGALGANAPATMPEPVGGATMGVKPDPGTHGVYATNTSFVCWVDYSNEFVRI